MHPPARHRAAKALLTLLVPCVLAGCINLGGGKPLPSLATLTPTIQTAPGQSISSRTAQALVVLPPEVARTLDGTRIPVQIDDSAVAYLTGAAWIAPPGQLFQGLLVDTIRARGKRLVLDENLPQSLIHLSGRLDKMGYDARTHTVVVQFNALLVTRDGVTTARSFVASEPNIDPVAAAVTPALNRVANDVAGQVADWVDQ